MIVKLNTAGATPTTTGGSLKWLGYVIVGGALIYLGYKYIYLPMKEKKSKAEGESNADGDDESNAGE